MKKLFCLLCFVAASVSTFAQAQIPGMRQKAVEDQKKSKILNMFTPFAGITMGDLEGNMLCFVAAPVSKFAQTRSPRMRQKAREEQKKTKILHMFAPFAGITMADLEGDGNHGPFPGFNGGVGAQLLNISRDVDLRTELGYSQQGTKSSYGESSYYSSKSTTRLNYLNVPVLAHYHHPSGFFAEAGLQPGILLSAKQKTTSSGMGGGGTTNTDIKKDLNGFDLGIPVGAGYVFKKKVAVSARVTPGLLNVVKSKDAAKQTNFVFSARASYLL
jgi:outer membrane immunogenic protein